jgi:NADP-dependent 3-hydroxy acid dehydrogenase YdfG
MKRKIWFITGISSGLGRALAQTVVEQGDFVIGTFRKQNQVNSFNSQYADQALAVVLDITKPEQIDNAFQFIRQKFGRIDVL